MELTKVSGRPMILPMTELGKEVRKARKAKGLSLQRLAALAGRPYRTVQAVEVGDIRRPSEDVLRPIAEALEPETDYERLVKLIYGIPITAA